MSNVERGFDQEPRSAVEKFVDDSFRSAELRVNAFESAVENSIDSGSIKKEGRENIYDPEFKEHLKVDIYSLGIGPHSDLEFNAFLESIVGSNEDYFLKEGLDLFRIKNGLAHNRFFRNSRREEFSDYETNTEYAKFLYEKARQLSLAHDAESSSFSEPFEGYVTELFGVGILVNTALSSSMETGLEIPAPALYSTALGKPIIVINGIYDDGRLVVRGDILFHELRHYVDLLYSDYSSLAKPSNSARIISGELTEADDVLEFSLTPAQVLHTETLARCEQSLHIDDYDLDRAVSRGVLTDAYVPEAIQDDPRVSESIINGVISLRTFSEILERYSGVPASRSVRIASEILYPWPVSKWSSVRDIFLKTLLKRDFKKQEALLRSGL